MSGVRRLLIEGWRFIHHSYALVAQSHCLCLLRRPDVDLRFVDLPYYFKRWRGIRGVFTAEQEALLASLRAPEPDFMPQATLTMRPERPDFSAPRSGRRFAFGTAEYRVLAEDKRSDLRSAAEVPDTVSVVTPSRWSALAYERFGLPRERVHVVPHGVDLEVLRPDAAARDATREALGLRDAFVYLSTGAMTGNKGVDVLLAAFARVAETEPRARLFLKGADALYSSRDMVRAVLDILPARSRETVAARLIYNGDTYSSRMMGDLFRAADVYVAPYRAEGFNLPVLEAAACGVPVICTAGGPTDEFTQESFARRIHSTPTQMPPGAPDVGDYLEPDLDHLIELMRQAMHEQDNAARAGAAGASYVAEHFTWERVTERLVEVLFPGVRAATAQ
ncbi:MAG TPA: glycosyltransferase family 4 protein [Casimicrobiaceae bacterium]|nr:glycosyltransferase family 4 protein [Casimicrobiaceae bacterium]